MVARDLLQVKQKCVKYKSVEFMLKCMKNVLLYSIDRGTGDASEINRKETFYIDIIAFFLNLYLPLWAGGYQIYLPHLKFSPPRAGGICFYKMLSPVYGSCESQNCRRFGCRATDVKNGNAGPK